MQRIKYFIGGFFFFLLMACATPFFLLFIAGKFIFDCFETYVSGLECGEKEKSNNGYYNRF